MKKILTFAGIVLIVGIAASCHKINVGEIPLPEGEVLNNVPVSLDQWAELAINEGYWDLDYCFRKKNGVWENDNTIEIRYTFYLPDKVDYYLANHHYNKEPGGPDGGDMELTTLEWHFDIDSSVMTIGDEFFKMLDAGRDTFFLLRDVNKTDPLSSVSWILYKFSRKDTNKNLASPGYVTIKNLTSNSVTIQWEKVEDATHYRWDLEAKEYFFSGGGITPENELTLDTHITAGTTYHFAVRSENNNINTLADGGPYPQCSSWIGCDFTTPPAD
jgi:hypothetical protein